MLTQLTVNMDLPILTQLTVSIELSRLTQLPSLFVFFFYLSESLSFKNTFHFNTIYLSDT